MSSGPAFRSRVCCPHLLQRARAGRALAAATLNVMVPREWLLAVAEAPRQAAKQAGGELPPGARFEHKTGTQHRRSCDLGIATVPSSRASGPPARVVIAACARGTGTAAGERALRGIGAAITASGVFVQAPPRPTVSPPGPA